MTPSNTPPVSQLRGPLFYCYKESFHSFIHSFLGYASVLSRRISLHPPMVPPRWSLHGSWFVASHMWCHKVWTPPTCVHLRLVQLFSSGGVTSRVLVMFWFLGICLSATFPFGERFLQKTLGAWMRERSTSQLEAAPFTPYHSPLSVCILFDRHVITSYLI